MPFSYPPEAIDACFQLYLRYNGAQFDRIEKEMRRTWQGWSKQNLFTRGDKLGWIEKYNWERALQEKIAQSASTQAVTEEQALFNEIAQMRKRLHERLSAEGCKDRDAVYQHLAYCRLGINALEKLRGAGLTADSFAAFWEHLLDWLTEMAPEAARSLLAVGDEVLERARSEYGEQEANNSRKL